MSEITERLPAAKVNKVLVSARRDGGRELEKINQQALETLFDKHVTIEKFNGENHFNLSDMEEKVVSAADGFLFLAMPPSHAHLEPSVAYRFYLEMFKIASLFVGVQTEDTKLRLAPGDSASPLKPVVLVNHNACYDPFLKLVRHLIKMGVVAERYHDVLKPVKNIDGAVHALHSAPHGKSANHYHHEGHTAHKKIAENLKVETDPTGVPKPAYNVCVFCSAGTRNNELIGIAHEAGRKLAGKGWGVISGMGKTGMMGAVVKGAVEEKRKSGKGWVAGSNLPRIINMEGLPEGYDRLWLESDIYKRMEVMIQNSQAFIIMPGGMGTIQELSGLLLLKYNAKHRKHEGQPYLMSDDIFGNKPIILVNHTFREGDVKGQEFWEPIVSMSQQFGFEHDIKVVDNVQQAIKLLEKHYEHGTGS
jgi:uncharacterized protein (TIGR00730 family)